MNSTDIQRGLGILHKNRDHMYTYEEWIKEGTLFEYLRIKPEILGILPKLWMSVEKSIGEDYFKGGKLIGVDETYFEEYEREPEFNTKKIIELSREGYFDRACEFLLNDESCEEHREFLFNRGVTVDEIRRNKLGSSKYVDDRFKELIGLTVHPMTKRYLGGDEIEGILIPFIWDGEVVAITTRAVPFEYMKFSTTAPDLTIGNIDEGYGEGNEELWVVEGKFDQMALNRIGIGGVVFLNGASPSLIQVASILTHVMKTKKRLVLALDSDNAGILNMLKLGVLASDLGVDVSYVLLDEGKDHAEAVIKYGFGMDDYERCMTTDVELLKEKLKMFEEPEIVSYDEYVKMRKGINVDFRDEMPE